MKNILFGGTFFVIAILFIVYFFLFKPYESISYRGTSNVEIVIPFGSSVWEIADILKENTIITSRYAFIFGAWRDELRGDFHAGTFSLPPNITAREVAFLLAKEEGVVEEKDVRITFPEGWTAQKMAERLNANDLPGDVFLEFFGNPDYFKEKYTFLSNIPEGGTLEGFLFPDTYLFDQESSAEKIIETLLDTFERKVLPVYQKASNERTLFDIITLASIIEGEVRGSEERKVVGGIFYKRLDIGMALQSDATLTYVLDEKKIQHGAQDLATDSLYNTYKYPGLPPGPVSNPSLDAIEASLFPQDSDYLYFLSDPETGMTYYAQDFEMHKANKVKAGL
jgi:UPF0755 protein